MYVGKSRWRGSLTTHARQFAPVVIDHIVLCARSQYLHHLLTPSIMMSARYLHPISEVHNGIPCSESSFLQVQSASFSTMS